MPKPAWPQSSASPLPEEVLAQLRRAGAFYGARRHMSGNFSVANSSVVELQWDTLDFDTDSYSQGINQFKTPYAGKYQFVLSIMWAGNTVGQREAIISVPTVTWLAYDSRAAINDAGGDSVAQTVTTPVVDMAAGTFVHAQAWQDSGAALNITSSAGGLSAFSVTYLGA